MKITLLLRSFVVACYALAACSKSHGPAPPITTTSSIAVTANDSLLHYSINNVYIQDVGSTHTTLISGEYPDTSGKKGSLAIRLPGDTTGRWTGTSLHVTYTDGKGNTYNNTSDTTNYVQLDKYPKTYNGVVSGSFTFATTGPAGTIRFSNGSIIAIFQK